MDVVCQLEWIPLQPVDMFAEDKERSRSLAAENYSVPKLQNTEDVELRWYWNVEKSQI